MSKITEAFKGKKAFIAYLMAGDPDLEKTAEYILALQDGGADIIEIGIPFSDPIAEGETIQNATLRSLSSGTTPDGIFEMMAELKDKVKIPLLFMSYANPIFSCGYDSFFKRCSESGISGVILPDVPFEEAGEVLSHTQKYGIEVITLVAPTSVRRIANIAKSARGFIYVVSSMGVTGVRTSVNRDIRSVIDAIKRQTDIPAAVGFGINTPKQAAELLQYADGIIVGSAIVNIIAENSADTAEKLKKYVRSMKG
ncbi:MAG: tryptophan synthase subunit alpha [Deferribacteraceae bacterium]|jgi:tryptophan synthase alpha chain|nr:tryptophan synthase subunit alpha [Deferribacteraceae bacterium]